MKSSSKLAIGLLVAAVVIIIVVVVIAIKKKKESEDNSDSDSDDGTVKPTFPLKRNDNKKQVGVLELQKALNRHDKKEGNQKLEHSLVEDGYFGAKTEAAVKIYFDKKEVDEALYKTILAL